MTSLKKSVFYGVANVSVSGQTSTNPPATVTASASGSATSHISQLDADSLAMINATTVANSALNNDINVINQAVEVIYANPQFALLSRHIPSSRQLVINHILDAMKTTNDERNIVTKFLYSNTLLSSYRGTPYLELHYLDSTGTNLVIYSTTYFQTPSYLFSNLGTDLVLDRTDVIINGSRIYMWDESIVNNLQVENDEFPMTKTFQFQPQYQTPQNITSQIMTKIASQPTSVKPAYYTTTTIYRETVNIYHASTLVYLLIDCNDTTTSTTNLPQTSRAKIYAMQTMTNEYFKDININNLYSLKNYLQLPKGTQPPTSTNTDYVPLPPGFNYVVYTVPYNYCAFSVSTLDENAILINDGCNNSYQYLHPKYNPFLYQQFNL